ncbi:unnamed protein product [Clonostachys solani]|uniref:Uncharacterized protein n=1 Tax=Clonostachys solani TaxID=160281 RepID=A0A9N9YY75_9HYPO|nr:unnamed protein product [Clonostachys solani]
MASRQRENTFSTAPWKAPANRSHHMDVGEAGSWMDGFGRSSGSGEVIHHISEGYDFTNALTSPIYPYSRDAQIVNEQLEHFYHDESPSNREVRRWLGDPDDIKRRGIFINCFIRHQWQNLGVWNDNWGIPGLPGYQNDIANWKWRWKENEDQYDFLAAYREKKHLAHIRRAARMAFALTPRSKQACLRRKPTVAEAEGYLSSRPWFVHGVQVKAMRARVGNHDGHKAARRVRITWRLQGKWESEWDHYSPGWRWGGDDMAIANPQFLLNLLSDNEKKALGLQDNPACPPRHRGHYSLSAGQSSRSSDTRWNETPRGQNVGHRRHQSNQWPPDIGHHHNGTKACAYQHKETTRDNRPQAFTGYRRFSEAYFARDWSPFGDHPASSGATGPVQILVDGDNGEEISEAISPLAPRIQISIENFNLGLSPAQFSL